MKEKQYETVEQFCVWYADTSNHFQPNLSDFMVSFYDYVWKKTDIYATYAPFSEVGIS